VRPENPPENKTRAIKAIALIFLHQNNYDIIFGNLPKNDYPICVKSI
jgi:hypothetical protein